MDRMGLNGPLSGGNLRMQKDKVLIVEDEVITSMDIEDKLSRLGYNVCAIVRYAEEVSNAVEAHQPDIVLMDINLKGEMKGTEAAEIIHNKYHVPIVFLTAYSDKDTLASSKLSEPYGFLKKPIQMEILRITLEMALNKAKSDREIYEGKQLLNDIFSSVQENISVMDRDFNILMVNSTVETEFASQQPLIGKKCYNVYQNRNNLCQPCHSEKALKSGVPQFGVSEVMTDRGMSYKDIYAYPMMRAGEDAPIGVIEFVRDVTEKKQIEMQNETYRKELELLNGQLEERVQEEVEKRIEIEKLKRQQDDLLLQKDKMAAMGELIDVIAHQWKQPLNGLGIIGQNLSDIASHTVMDTDELIKYANLVNQQVDFMNNTIDHFRQFLNTSEGKTSFKPCGAAIFVTKLLEPQFMRERITVDILDHECIEIFGYMNELQQVILNLMNNSKEAFINNPDVDEKKIELSFSVTDTFFMISIKDTAGGIPEEVLSSLFDLHSTTKRDHMGGVGLHLSKMVIEKKFSGTIQARNVQNGAEFIIKLPFDCYKVGH